MASSSLKKKKRNRRHNRLFSKQMFKINKDLCYTKKIAQNCWQNIKPLKKKSFALKEMLLSDFEDIVLVWSLCGLHL